MKLKGRVTRSEENDELGYLKLGKLHKDISTNVR